MNLILPMCLLYVAVKRARGQSNVIGSNKTVRAVVGHDAILPCHLEPPFDVTTLLVMWKRDGAVVHVQRNGHVAQEKNFRSRTSLFHDEMVKGNISLKLTNVTKRDEGNYTCNVPSHTLQTNVRSGNVTLIVELMKKSNKGNQMYDEPETENHQDGNSTGSTNTLSGGAIAGIVIAVIVIAVTALAIIAGVIPGGFYGRCPFLLSFPCGRRFEDVRQSDPDAPVAHNGPVQAVDGRAGDQEEPKDQKEGEEGIPLRGIGDQNPPGKKTSEAGTSLVFGQSLASL
ncbi:uncharacterized protein LOC114573985 [Perca flavescens]|uniref:uncharacterized protein LOC114573985 n=1 Tax=Perca flavescens TaxID=8167 RepID=UPI00106E877A|nr:uncharacterized protein LOC114573985 [Perca flavescens]